MSTELYEHPCRQKRIYGMTMATLSLPIGMSWDHIRPDDDLLPDPTSLEDTKDCS